MKYLKKLWNKFFGKSVVVSPDGGTVTTNPVQEPEVQLPLPIELPSEEAGETKSEIDKILEALVIRPAKFAELASVCNIIKMNKEWYKEVEAETGVPWDVVAGCHYRESSLDFNCCLHNGETLANVNKYGTRLVPKDRGKNKNWTWSQAAIDAMMIEKHKFPSEWSTAGKLDFCEKFNGLGYRARGVPSPYVYAGTTKYVSGLYVADGKYSSSKVDQRLGCAAIIKGLIS